MTYIEFFDEDVVENIYGCLVSVPDRVILIGNKAKKLEKHAERYHEFFLRRGHDVDFIPKVVDRYDLEDIIEKLSAIVEEYDDCVFDLTGGQELMLVALGIVYHRYRDMDLQMQYFNLKTNTLFDVDNDGTVIRADSLPTLSAQELVRLYGGRIVYEEEKPGATHRWQWSEEFMDDIDTMWEICSMNVRAWNTQIGVFAAAEELNGGGDPLVTAIDVPQVTDYLNGIKAKYVEITRIIRELQENGLIVYDDSGSDLITISYKNEQIKRILTKAGLALELKIALTAMRVRDKDGDYIYHDVMNGAYIDWDGDVHSMQEGYDTENEIDVLMIHGVVPVFVSCKNGMIDIDELYKLDAVARRFGGKYAKKVLVATALGAGPFAEYLRQRADEMMIRIVDNAADTSEENLERIVTSLWSN